MEKSFLDIRYLGHYLERVGIRNTGFILVKQPGLQREAEKKFFFSGLATKRGGVKAWPLRKNTVF